MSELGEGGIALGKLGRIILGAILLNMMFIPLIHRSAGGVSATETLESLERFAGQKIQLGYHLGERTLGADFFEAMSQVLEEKHAIKIEMVGYESLEELEEDMLQGKIDAYVLRMFEDEESEQERGRVYFHYSTFTSNKVIYTNFENPLYNITDLTDRKVGFIKGSRFIQDYVEEHGDNVDMVIFDTSDEGLDALEQQEVDLIISHEQLRKDMIERESLQAEYAFRDKVHKIQFATVKEEVYLLFQAVEEVFRSSEGEEFFQKITEVSEQIFREKIKDYIQVKYQDILRQYDSIAIGTHNVNFPYSFFGADGTPTGIYIEIVELFQYATGIQYEIVNTMEDTFQPDLREKLIENQIQFIFGYTVAETIDEIVKVGNVVVEDNVTTVANVGNEEFANRHMNTLRWGIISGFERVANQIFYGYQAVTREEYQRYLSEEGKSPEEFYYIIYDDYPSIIQAVIDGEIDVFLCRESVAQYYQYITDDVFLVDVGVVEKAFTHGISGNAFNEELNAVMADIQRLYNLLYIESQVVEWGNMMVEYQSKYYDVVEQQGFYRILLTIIPLCFIILIIVYILWRKHRDYQQLKIKNDIDELTGLYSKYAYKEKCLKLIQKYPNKLGVLFFIDLNDFKSFNDNYGHIVGDDVLRKFGEALKSLEDKQTVSFRIAGDEFGIFRTGFQNSKEVAQEIQQMKREMECEIVIENHVFPIKFSTGVSIYQLDTTNFEKLFEYADFAMYQAKKRKDIENFPLAIFAADLYQADKEKNEMS